MKYHVFLAVALFSFSKIYSQTKDSSDQIKQIINTYNLMFGKVDGKELTDFKAKDLEGCVYTNKDFKDKITFLNLWFADCAPCIEEIPYLNRLYQMFKDSAAFQLYAMTFENKETAMQIIDKYEIKFPILLASQKTVRSLTFGRGFPTNIILDSLGKVQIIYGGIKYPKSEVDVFFKNELDKLLQKKEN